MGNGEDRLVLVLRQVRERLEALVQVRLRLDHHRLARRRRGARDPLARPHPRATGHLLDPRAEGRAQHELVGLLVVEIDEAGVGAERVGDLALATSDRTSSRSSVELTAAIVLVSRRRCLAGLVHLAIVGSRSNPYAPAR